MSPDFKIAKVAPDSIINMDSLRSGAEFKKGLAAASDDERKRSLSINERLQQFHDITQIASIVPGLILLLIDAFILCRSLNFFHLSFCCLL